MRYSGKGGKKTKRSTTKKAKALRKTKSQRRTKTSKKGGKKRGGGYKKGGRKYGGKYQRGGSIPIISDILNHAGYAGSQLVNGLQGEPVPANENPNPIEGHYQ